MIKKLRIKLIAASMLSLFLVLFVIGGIAGVLNYKKIVNDADRECLRRFLMSPDFFRFCLMRMEILF